MSTTQEIVITQFDHDRLSALLERLRRQQELWADSAAALEEELERATIVAPTQVPADVVTMNSEVHVADLDSDEILRVSVVFPGAASPRTGKVSVLAPLGLALLGARVGEEITWAMPGGVRRLKILTILFQPEASGRFDL
jgi:regulator of nucleoside diphosphate kinase